jgi:hypothetical protein
MKPNNSCSKGKCPAPKIQNKHRNGKGDKPRPFEKKQYDKNYESINWKKR